MDEELEQEAKSVAQSLWISLEKERQSHRAIFPGSYDPTQYSLMIDSNLPDPEKTVVCLHEYAHYMIGQCHWGEAIRRLDHLQVIIALSLNLLRGTIITRLLRKSKDRDLQLDDFKSISEDSAIRSKIRHALSNDNTFMTALHLINDLEKRKNELSAQSILVDEGFAYWACIKLLTEVAEGHAEAKKVCQLAKELEINFRERLPKHLLEAYLKVSDIAKVMSDEFSSVYQVPYVCVNPQLAQIEFLGSDITDFRMQISNEAISPDKRFWKASEAIASGKWTNTTDSHEMYRLCDPQNAEPKMFIDDFNDYWYRTVDAHPKVLGLINEIHRRIGIKTSYKPPLIEKGKGSSELPPPPLIELTGTAQKLKTPEWGLGEHLMNPKELSEDTDMSEVARSYQQMALMRDSLMKTMESEGLI